MSESLLKELYVVVAKREGREDILAIRSDGVMELAIFVVPEEANDAVEKARAAMPENIALDVCRYERVA